MKGGEPVHGLTQNQGHTTAAKKIKQPKTTHTILSSWWIIMLCIRSFKFLCEVPVYYGIVEVCGIAIGSQSTRLFLVVEVCGTAIKLYRKFVLDIPDTTSTMQQSAFLATFSDTGVKVMLIGSCMHSRAAQFRAALQLR